MSKLHQGAIKDVNIFVNPDEKYIFKKIIIQSELAGSTTQRLLIYIFIYIIPELHKQRFRN